MATMNVSLPDQMKAWVEDQTTDGRYSNASDYVRDLIRKDKERRDSIVKMQALITDGINRGNHKPFDRTKFEAVIRQADNGK